MSRDTKGNGSVIGKQVGTKITIMARNVLFMLISPADQQTTKVNYTSNRF